MLIVVFSYGIFRLSVQPEDKKSVKVGVIQGNIAQDLKWRQDLRQEILGKYLSLTKLLAEKNPDLIIWPETSLPYWADKTDGSLKMIEDLLRKATSKPLLLGCVFSSQEEFFNSALFFTKERISNYNKIHLVPFGEYIPLRKKLPVLEMIVNQVVPIADFSFGKEFTVFDFSPKFSVLICFEDTISNLSRNFVKNGARMLVNITNDAWFWDSSSPYQHLQSSVFRAVENHVSLVRSANTGVSCFINDKGKIHAYVQDEFGKKTFIQGVLVGDVSYQENAKLTFYTRYGDIFIFVCFGVAIYVIITKIIKRNKPKRNV